MDHQEPQELNNENEVLEDLDLDAIIKEFNALDGEDLPDPELPPEMIPEEPAPLTDDTIRMDPAQLPKGSYSGAVVIDDEEEEPEAPSQEPEEAFSDQWEPEYEQPMGEYVPPQPILFYPHSRLRELKRKLVAGPEKRYYQLMELGVGKLQILLFITLIVTILCGGSTVMYAVGMVQADRLRLMIFGQLLSIFLCALIGSHRLIEGLADLIHGRFSLNTLLIFSFILCCIDGLLCLQQLRVPCCAPFTLLVFFSLLDSLYRRRTETNQMDAMRKATNLTSIRVSKQPLNEQKVFLRQNGQVDEFMDSYRSRPVPDKLRSWYTIGALIASVGVGITGAVLHDISTGVQIAAVTLLAAVPASFFITLSRPADILQKRLSRLGCVLCGWKGVEAAAGKAIFPVSHFDLFPAGTVKMNGVKFFGAREPDEVVAYGTSLILADGSGLAPLFEQVLESRNCHHLATQDFQRYTGGIGGSVRGENVLVGSLHFLRDMDVEIPEGLKVSHAVCVAIDGVLCGLFAISYEKDWNATGGLHTLCNYRGLNPVISDSDFLLTPGFLRSKFGINPKKITIADSQVRGALSEMEADMESTPVALVTKSDLSAAAFGITGARSLRNASYLGLIVHMIGGIVGIGMMLTLTIIGHIELLTPLNILLYQLIWSIPGILLTEWTRLI